MTDKEIINDSELVSNIPVKKKYNTAIVPRHLLTPEELEKLIAYETDVANGIRRYGRPPLGYVKPPVKKNKPGRPKSKKRKSIKKKIGRRKGTPAITIQTSLSENIPDSVKEKIKYPIRNLTYFSKIPKGSTAIGQVDLADILADLLKMDPQKLRDKLSPLREELLNVLSQNLTIAVPGAFHMYPYTIPACERYDVTIKKVRFINERLSLKIFGTNNFISDLKIRTTKLNDIDMF